MHTTFFKNRLWRWEIKVIRMYVGNGVCALCVCDSVRLQCLTRERETERVAKCAIGGGGGCNSSSSSNGFFSTSIIPNTRIFIYICVRMLRKQCSAIEAGAILNTDRPTDPVLPRNKLFHTWKLQIHPKLCIHIYAIILVVYVILFITHWVFQRRARTIHTRTSYTHIHKEQATSTSTSWLAIDIMEPSLILAIRVFRVSYALVATHTHAHSHTFIPSAACMVLRPCAPIHSVHHHCWAYIYRGILLPGTNRSTTCLLAFRLHRARSERGTQCTLQYYYYMYDCVQRCGAATISSVCVPYCSRWKRIEI